MAYSPRQHPITIAQATGVQNPMEASAPPLTGANTATSSMKRDLPAGVSVASATSPLQSALTQRRNTDNLDPALRNYVNNRQANAPSNGPVIVPASAEGVMLASSPEASWGDNMISGLVPGLKDDVAAMPGALSAASAARQSAYDNKIALSNDYIGKMSQPDKSDIWGRFAQGLLQPTSTGSFAEGWGNAAGAAMDQRSLERRESREKDEKLWRSRMALEELTAEKPSSAVDALKDRLSMVGTIETVNGVVADDGLRNGLTPQGDAALLADHASNPGKYAGKRGQQMVADAESRLSESSKREHELNKIRLQAELRGAGKSGNMSATAQKALMEADENALNSQSSRDVLSSLLAPSEDYGGKSINDAAYSGGLADYAPSAARIPGASWFVDENRAKATTELQNRVLTQALSTLKSTFGAAPTEGERKILVDLQASVEKTPSEREAIIKQALGMLSIRERFNREKAAAIRNGTYFGPDGMPSVEMPDVRSVPDDTDLLEDGAVYQLDDGSVGQYDAAAGGFHTVEE